MILNIILISIVIIFLGILVRGVYNVLVKKKRYDNMYTPFDDAMKGTKRENDNEH
ncbi:hypothetical protein J14TS2_28790 [Bacillus sp. J14TS2]|uniref:DUF3951 domain-containing protein n=1 Tax=Bacillus sp. J14TS2 TaxID=2807188 RepID=UPI001B068A39|nr:hypothetical protein J14TS2_28790 [Bacillus sp. J14TS2]